jgi:heptosyltransferase-1
MDNPQKVLIVKLSSMGDIVHSLPVAESLKSKFPDFFIGWAVEEDFKDILHAAPYIDRVYPLNTKQWRRDLRYNTLREISSAIKEIRDANFDTAIDVQGLVKSGVITYLSGAPFRIGFSKSYARERLSALFINKEMTPPAELIHIIDQNLYLIRDIAGEVGSAYPRLFLTEKDELWAMGELRRMGIMDGDLKVFIAPGAGWITKLWSSEKYRNLIIELYKRYQARVILSGSYADRGLIEEIKEGISFPLSQFIGGSIGQMMALLKNVDLVIGGDTGPIHIASALGTPTLSLYGPSAGKRSGPRGEGHEWIQSDIPCSPCFGRECRLRGLKTQDSRLRFKEVPCMEAISINSVKIKLEGIMNRMASYSVGGPAHRA